MRVSPRLYNHGIPDHKTSLSIPGMPLRVVSFYIFFFLGFLQCRSSRLFHVVKGQATCKDIHNRRIVEDTGVRGEFISKSIGKSKVKQRCNMFQCATISANLVDFQ